MAAAPKAGNHTIFHACFNDSALSHQTGWNLGSSCGWFPWHGPAQQKKPVIHRLSVRCAP
jgi:hypothetical protein